MLGKKMTILISIIAVAALTSIAFGTIYYTNTNLSAAEGGYLEIVNHTKSIYEITNNSTELTLNFTVYSSSSTIYIFDISPLNNTMSVWQNITSFNVTTYPSNYIERNVANGTNLSINLSLNKNVVQEMKTSNPGIGEIYAYPVKIVVLSGDLGSSGFGFALMKLS